MYLGNITTFEAKEILKKDPIIVIPVGSTEQHGNQCALGTDYIVPTYLADYIANKENIVVVPTIPYGVCPYHLSFAGSIDIGYEGLYLVLKGIISSLMNHGAKRFLILNGHGGNNPSIDKAALEAYHNGGICACIDWWSLVAQLDSKYLGGHGDILETSVMMAISPDYVKLNLSEPMNEQNPTNSVKAHYIQGVNFKGGVIRVIRDTKEIAPSGWFGPFDPKDSNVELGTGALELVKNYISEFIEEFRKF